MYSIVVDDFRRISACGYNVTEQECPFCTMHSATPKQCARVESHPVTQSSELGWNEGLLSKKKASTTGKGYKARFGRHFPFLAQPPWSQGCPIGYLAVMPSQEVTDRQANGLAWTLISWGTEKGLREEPETWKSREKNKSENKMGSWPTETRVDREFRKEAK